MKKVELLAPGGSKESFIAAVQNGANAIYVGGQQFGARAYAKNFTNEELVELFEYAHIRGVKVYVTVNTVVFEDEFESVKQYLDFLYINQCDGVIVQDLGVVSYLRNTYPDFKIVGSTQMNIHNVEGAKFLESLGLERVVLARETTLKEVEEIKKNTNIELEVFGHGALCVSYSGQCLMSSFIGNRSGNRGRCAQSCRLNYRLIKNEEYLNNPSPLLSTKDLLTLDNLPSLLKSGISSIKIEGRMKSAEYVAQVVSTYRKAIDLYYKKQEYNTLRQDVYNLKRVFNREFTKGYILNEHDGDLVNIYRNNHQGVEIGKVSNVSKDLIKIQLKEDLNQFDGIRIVSKEDVGFIVNKMEVKGLLVNKAKKGDTVYLRGKYKVRVNDIVLKTQDVELMNELGKTFDKEYRKCNLKAVLVANVGEHLKLTYNDYEGHEVSEESTYIVEKALKAPLEKERALEQINKLGNTAYTVNKFVFISDNEAMVPMKFINELRVSLVNKLNELRINKYPKRCLKEEVFLTLPKNRNNTASLRVKIQKEEQVLPLLNKGLNEIYVKGKRLYDRLKSKYPDERFIYAYNRIEDYKVNVNGSVLICENGGLNKAKDSNIYSDVYLNITNSRALAFLSSLGVKRTGISLEISKSSLELMIENYKKNYYTNPTIEMVVYGHVDLMLSKYCPIAKVNGNKQKHCMECHLNKYELEDRLGVKFPLEGDDNCIMHIYNSRRLHLLEYLKEIKGLVGNVRLDFTIESKEEVEQIVDAYLSVYNEEYESLILDNVTYGHYKNKVE